jgi:putative transposase
VDLGLLHPRETIEGVIASDRLALKVGSSKLVVDGTDETLARKAEFSLFPNRCQARALNALVDWSREVYNGSLEHRRHAWHRAKVPVSRFDQFNEVPSLRDVCPQVARFGIQPVRGAIARVDEAFAAFYRRTRDGQTPGYPRFKSRRRFRTVMYDEPVNWALKGIGSTKSSSPSTPPTLYLKGVGQITLSNKAVRQLVRLMRRGGEARTLTITRTATGAWRATVCFRGVEAKHLATNDQVGGVDRGVWVTAALPDGTLLRCPPFLRQARREIAALSREREQHPTFSPEWKRANKATAKAYRKAHHRSENWARHTAISIVAAYGVICLEDLHLENMTKSARGTVASPGRGVSQKKGLNRSLQDAALGRLAYWICVKAEEAGRRVWKVDPRNSSRQCAPCGHTEAANRRRSCFLCRRCDHAEHADVNAAQVLTARGQAADTQWKEMGSPLLTRPVPRNRRHQPAPSVPDQLGDGETCSSGPRRLLTR